MGRQPCRDKLGVKKGPWTAEEDKKLINFILTNGHCCWRAVPKLAGLRRCGKSCRLRWTNYLRPDLKRGLLSEAEELLIIEFHARLGNRWSKIAARLPGRTDNEIKNHWNTHIKKKLLKMGIDPVTHEPLQKEAKETETFPEADTLYKPKNHNVQEPETKGISSSEEMSSCSPTENCSNNEPNSVGSLCDGDRELITLLRNEAPLIDDAPYWDILAINGQNISSVGMPSMDEYFAWMMDFQEFGVRDFGFDCFTDMETNVLDTLDIGKNQ